MQCSYLSTHSHHLLIESIRALRWLDWAKGGGVAMNPQNLAKASRLQQSAKDWSVPSNFSKSERFGFDRKDPARPKARSFLGTTIHWSKARAKLPAEDGRGTWLVPTRGGSRPLRSLEDGSFSWWPRWARKQAGSPLVCLVSGICSGGWAGGRWGEPTTAREEKRARLLLVAAAAESRLRPPRASLATTGTGKSLLLFLPAFFLFLLPFPSLFLFLLC
jgi:hypothetical protein